MSWTHIIKTNQCFVFRSMLIKRPRTCIAAIHCNPPECHLIEPRSTIPNMCVNLRTYANSKIHVLYHDFFSHMYIPFQSTFFFCLKNDGSLASVFFTHLHHFHLRNVGSFSSLHMIQSNTSEPKNITQPNPRPKKITVVSAKTWWRAIPLTLRKHGCAFLLVHTTASVASVSLVSKYTTDIQNMCVKGSCAGAYYFKRGAKEVQSVHIC